MHRNINHHHRTSKNAEEAKKQPTGEGESMEERLQFTDKNGNTKYVGHEARTAKPKILADPYGFAGIAIGKPPPGGKGFTGYGGAGGGYYGSGKKLQKLVIGVVVGCALVYSYTSYCGSFGWWGKPWYCDLV